MDNTYEGEYNVAGQREGHGVCRLANGNVYEGQWKADQYEGRGKYTVRRGDVYEGQYKAGVMEGHGMMTFANGDVYDGQYKAGVMDGHGTFLYRGDPEKSGDTYTGEFKMGNREGRGMYKFASGPTMVSWYLADRPEGEGAVWNSDSDEVWRMMHGEPVEAISCDEAQRIAERVDSMAGSA